MDFDERYRNDVIEYVIKKYGEYKVAHIITFATIKAKQAIRDAARVLGLSFSSGDKVAVHLIRGGNRFIRSITLS